MNNPEKQVKQQLEAEGWKVLRGGAPDFIILKVDSEGRITEAEGREVKSKNSKLSYEQGIYKMIFEMAGIPYKVVVTDQTTPPQARPRHSTPSQTYPTHANPHLARPVHSSPTQTIPNQFYFKEVENAENL